MFHTLLIANRGEIACRIARTARRMGIATVAVYSAADADALHVKAADRAIQIGPAAARESYLNIGRIIEAARRSGADAIHPGYGFLSENPEFAEACAEAGIIFVGPPPSAMRAMGSKSAAKSLMEQSGVPLLPGYHGERQGAAFLADQAARDRLPADDQGGVRRRRSRHADRVSRRRIRHGPGFGAAGSRIGVRRRPRAARTLPASIRGTSRCRCSPIGMAMPSICSSVTARCSGAIRR